MRDYFSELRSNISPDRCQDLIELIDEAVGPADPDRMLDGLRELRSTYEANKEHYTERVDLHRAEFDSALKYKNYQDEGLHLVVERIDFEEQRYESQARGMDPSVQHDAVVQHPSLATPHPPTAPSPFVAVPPQHLLLGLLHHQLSTQHQFLRLCRPARNRMISLRCSKLLLCK